jgi:hypothetical protein
MVEETAKHHTPGSSGGMQRTPSAKAVAQVLAERLPGAAAGDE